ncbi:MAG: hypothetical protein ABW048_08330, partial [Sphingobium sp.]
MTRATNPHARQSRLRIAPWMIRTSVLAMGIAIVGLGATSPVLSQSFNGSAITVAGQVDSINTSNSGTTTVTLNGSFSGQAVINWTPDPSGTGPINFQNAGTTATFQRSGGQDFAVLNRIIPGDPSRPVVFNGNVY